MRQKTKKGQLQQLPLPLLGDGQPDTAGVTPSTYQTAIFDFMRKGSGDGLINAVAGAGKTWTLLQAARLLDPRRRATFAAFNRHIADTLKARLRGIPMTAHTIHGIGYGCLIKQVGHDLRIDDRKYKMLARAWVERYILLHRVFLKPAELNERIDALTGLVHVARLTLTPAQDLAARGDLAARFDLLLPEAFWPGVADVLEQGKGLTMDEHVIDFADMLWLPHRWQLHPPPVDYLFIDEAQDLSPAQLELVLRSRAEGGRMLFVGDPAQSIFAFAGADADSFWRIKARTNAIELPLSICYRCPQSHLRIARKIVPHIEPRPDAPEGVVEHLPEAQLAQHLREGDLVLCRMTAPLVSWCIRLIQAGIFARVRGVDVGVSLIQLARRVGESESFTYRLFLVHLDALEAEQHAYLAQRRNSAGRLQSLQDQCEARRAAYQSLAVTDLDGLCRAIHRLFADNRPPVWLSTIHRAKGLESDNVFILYPHRLPLEWPEQQPWEWAQELNLRYVAVTRTRQRLVILQPEGLSVDYTDDCISYRMVEKRSQYGQQGVDRQDVMGGAEGRTGFRDDAHPTG